MWRRLGDHDDDGHSAAHRVVSEPLTLPQQLACVHRCQHNFAKVFIISIRIAFTLMNIFRYYA